MALKYLSFAVRNPLRVLAVTFFALAFPAAVHAQSACDPQYMDALEARAFMEAQREIAQNQNLILKPDSVFEYTCFDGMLNAVVNANGDGPFSETSRWGNVPGQDASSLDNAVRGVVGASLNAYISSNFGHNFLGGRSTNNHTPGNVSGGAYSCDRMNAVWNDAQCMNMFQDAARDGFYDFRRYVGWDPRNRPSGGQCTSPLANGDFQMAFNSQEARYLLAAENPMDGTAYTADPMLGYLEQINPVGVAPATACAAGIPTGITVTPGGPAAAYQERICPNPGCYFNGSNCVNN